MVRFDPSRLDMEPYGFSCKRWAPVCMRRPDRHNEIELNLLTDGWITYLFGGKLIRVEANQLTAFWAAIPHQIIDHGAQSDYFVLTIPLGWFLRLRLPERFVQALLRGQMLGPSIHGHEAFEIARLTEWEQDFEAHEPKACTATLLEIESLLRRLSLRCPSLSEATTPPSTSPPALLHDGGLAKAEKMAHLVANRYTEQIDARTFAKEVDLNPKHAMKLFHLIFGTSLTSYITEYRLSQAQRLLVTSTASIVDISESSGFGSLSCFNRVFRQMCGCSPREYRKNHSITQGAGKKMAD